MTDATPADGAANGTTLKEKAKAATKAAALAAEKTKISKVSLPSAYAALGKACYQKKQWEEDFPEIYQELRDLSAKQKEAKEKAAQEPEVKGFAGKAKSIARKGLHLAKNQQLNLQISLALARLGQAAFEQHGKESGPEEHVSAIEQLTARVAEIDNETGGQVSTAREDIGSTATAEGRTENKKWFIIQDDKKLGPYSSKSLRTMARDGAITTIDLVWTERLRKPKPAGEIPGLFLERQSHRSKSTTTPDPDSAENKLSHGAIIKPSSLKKRAAEAAEYAALYAEHTRLKTVSLQQLYYKMGKQAYQARYAEKNLPDLFEKIDGLLRSSKESTSSPSAQETVTGTVGQLKGLFSTAVQHTKSAGLLADIQRQYFFLGKQLVDMKLAEQLNQNLHSEIVRLLGRVEEIERKLPSKARGKTQWLAPARAAAALVAFVFISGLLFSWLGSNAENNSTSLTVSNGEAVQNPAPQAAGLPPELLGELPASASKVLNVETVSGVPRFSPKSTLLFMISDELSIWNVVSGDQIIPTGGECDYFSIPAALSTDERQIACLDGDFLRLWDISTAEAKLLGSTRITGGSEFTRASWASADTVILSNPWKSYAVVKKTDGGTWAVAKTLSGRDLLALSPDGEVQATLSNDGRSVDVVIRRGDAESARIQVGSLEKSLGIFNHGSFPPRNESSVAFLPDGSGVAVADEVQNRDGEGQVRIRLFALDTGKLIGEPWLLGSPRLASQTVNIAGLTSDGKEIVALVSDSSKTSRSEQWNHFLWRWKVGSSQPTNGQLNVPNDVRNQIGQFFGMGLASLVLNQYPIPRNEDGESLGESSAQQYVFQNMSREGYLAIGLSDENQPVLIASQGKRTWDRESNRPTAERTQVYRLDFGTGGHSPDALLSLGVALPLHFSADGKYIAWPGRIASLQEMKQAGEKAEQANKAWEASDYRRAFEIYTDLVRYPEAAEIGLSMGQMYSRCIDYLVHAGREDDARNTVAWLQDSGFSYDPELDVGNDLLATINKERAAVAKREEMEVETAEADRLAEVRKRNRLNAVDADRLSCREFIRAIDTYKESGIVSEATTAAFFRDFAFEDIFGEPELNREWIESKRLYTYRCADGAVVLTVFSGLHGNVTVEDYSIIR